MTIPAFYSCDGWGHVEIIMKSHAEAIVKMEAGALIAKVRQIAWPKNREELENT